MAPFLILLLFTVIDFGRFAYASITVSNAARAGAAACNYEKPSSCPGAAASLSAPDVPACVSPATVNKAQQEALNEVGCSIALTPSDITTSVTALSTRISVLNVTVHHTFSTLLPLPHPTGSGWAWDYITFPVARTAQMTMNLL
jgi:hypothetical protein